MRVERLALDVLRWMLLSVDVSGVASFDEVVRNIGLALEALMLDSDAPLPLAVRVQLVGRTPVHGELFGFEHQLRAEVLGITRMSIGQVVRAALPWLSILLAFLVSVWFQRTRTTRQTVSYP